MSTKPRITPVGEFNFPHLIGADYKYKPEGEFHVKLILSKAEAREDIEAIKEVIKVQVAEYHKKKPSSTSAIKRAPLPYKDDENDKDKVVFSFKMKASGKNGKTGVAFKQQPQLSNADASAFDMSKKIYGGTKGRIKYYPYGYYVDAQGVGCSLRLMGAQITDLVEGGGPMFNPINLDGSVLPAPDKAPF